MKRDGFRFMGVIFMVLIQAMVGMGQIQSDAPQVGYVYPAGGQCGSSFEVTVGGKFLDEDTVALFSGTGVEAKVVEYLRPLNQGAFKELQNRMGELMRKKEAAFGNSSSRGRRRRSSTAFNDQWSMQDEEELNAMRRRLSTFSIRRSSVAALVETVTFEVTIAPDAELGPHELRLYTDDGLSNPWIFHVDPLPEITEVSGRTLAIAASQKRGGRGRKRQKTDGVAPGTHPVTTDPEEDISVNIPCLVNGQILPGDADRYRFKASKGQHLVVSTLARQLNPFLSDAVPGWFQAIVVLYDVHGRELAFADDFSFRPDPLLHCVIPQNGYYVVEIRDALYRGREDFVYRMALGELPFITDIFPLGGHRRGETPVTLSGWNLPQAQRMYHADALGLHTISVHKGKLLSNQIPFVVDDQPAIREQGDHTLFQSITLPAIIDGRIDSKSDRDVFRFSAQAGQTIVARILARQLGSPLDSVLKLSTETGEQLAFSDDNSNNQPGLLTHHADAELSATLPKDGYFDLTVADVQQQGGQDYAYRLYLHAPRPDFQLYVVPSSINARAGTTVSLAVHVRRQDGFDGPIELTLEPPVPGFALSGVSLASGTDVLPLTLTVPRQALELQSLRVVGKAMIAGRSVMHTAIPADQRKQAFIYQHLVPAQDLQVAVIGRASQSRFTWLDTDTLKIPAGGHIKVPIGIPRRSPFGEIQLLLMDPPEGIRIENVQLGRRRSYVEFVCDPTETKVGLQGNLIVNAYAVKTQSGASKAKDQRIKTRRFLSTLPAISFEIVME